MVEDKLSKELWQTILPLHCTQRYGLKQVNNVVLFLKSLVAGSSCIANKRKVGKRKALQSVIIPLILTTNFQRSDTLTSPEG